MINIEENEMKLRIFLAIIMMLSVASLAGAQVVGSAHDLSSTGPGAQSNVTRVCVFCHTPHQAVAAAGQDPLWNHTLSGHATYGVYGSDTLDAVPTEIGGAVAGSASVSNLCLSCHDGTVAVHSLYNDPNEVASVTIAAGGNVTAAGMITGLPLTGTDLTNDHPVNFTYDAALANADGDLATPDSVDYVDVAETVPLFDGTVQCGSCHDPHSVAFPPFMVRDNSSSGLCTVCHNK
jgi:predicted CXXCH cytochrome family protein